MIWFGVGALVLVCLWLIARNICPPLSAVDQECSRIDAELDHAD